MDTRPTLRLEATFGAADSVDGHGTSVRVRRWDGESATWRPLDITDATASQTTVPLPGGQLFCFVNDAIRDDEIRRQAESQIAQLDTNRDGNLDQDEAGARPELLPSWELADVDKNGRLDVQEITDILGKQQSLYRRQVRVRVDFPEDTLFFYLDEDRNGKLTAVEVAGASERLHALASADRKSLRPRDLPPVLWLGLGRASADQSEPLARPQPRAHADSASTPAWFQSMDRNADGLIGRREFLGRSDQFDSLDTNHDQQLDGSEVASSQ
jgi:hypothetical protein